MVSEVGEMCGWCRVVGEICGLCPESGDGVAL